MLTWICANAATIIISAVLIVIVAFIIRGLARGKIKTCGECGSDCAAGFGACRFSGKCQSAGGKGTQ